MPEYRFYKIAKNGHVAGPASAEALPDDRTAVAKAKQLVNGHDVEIWQETRLVTYVTPDHK